MASRVSELDDSGSYNYKSTMSHGYRKKNVIKSNIFQFRYFIALVVNLITTFCMGSKHPKKSKFKRTYPKYVLELG